MGTCKHLRVEEHTYGFMTGKGVRCVDCHAVMTSSALGVEFLRRQGKFKSAPIPLERKFWKEFINREPDPMSYEARMRGYDNVHVVRR